MCDGRESPAELRVLFANMKEVPQRLWMGQEHDLVVLDARHKKFLDTFGGTSGTICRGGALLLCAPPMEEWKTMDRQGSRWHRIITRAKVSETGMPNVVLVEEGGPVVDVTGEIPSIPMSPPQADLATMTPRPGQRRLMEAVVGTNSSNPLVCLGHRGRGKSAALGMAAALMLQRSGGLVLVTSPSQAATWQIFECAQRFLSTDDNVRRDRPFKLSVGKRGRMEFASPADLLTEIGVERLRSAHFVFVDEAAGVPVATLLEILSYTRRAVLSTTTDGYEGSGQGFLTRAVPKLKALRQGLRVMHLDEALRWDEGCPLEGLCRAVMLLDSEPVSVESVKNVLQQSKPPEFKYEQLDTERLAMPENEGELRQIFGLLRQGHYKTRPSDLETFLGMPGMMWLLLRCESLPVGLTTSSIEEPLDDPKAAQELWMKHRKVRGYLTIQTLSREAGFPEASRMKFARMMRIVLHPGVHHKGLGRALLERNVQALKEIEGVDAVAAHLGSTPWLLRLWRSQGARLVWLGHGCDPSSGQHSATLLVPLSQRAAELTDRLQDRLASQFLDLLTGPLRNLDVEALREVLMLLPSACPKEVDFRDAADAWSYAFGAREFSCCRAALRRVSLVALREGMLKVPRPRKRGHGSEEHVFLTLLRGQTVEDTPCRRAFKALPLIANFRPNF